MVNAGGYDIKILLLYLLVFGVPAALARVVAEKKNRNPLWWSLFSAVFPVTLIALFFVKTIPVSSDVLFCSNCGLDGTPVIKRVGNIQIEVLLWLCGIIPGIVYSSWSYGSASAVCPSCSSNNMIPLNSPNARVAS